MYILIFIYSYIHVYNILKSNYEGNCQESRYEAHGGNIY